jgi:hypothetical protein
VPPKVTVKFPSGLLLQFDKSAMQTWYFLVIGVPIVTSFVISLTVYLVYAKLLEREHLPDGKTRFRCK